MSGTDEPAPESTDSADTDGGVDGPGVAEEAGLSDHDEVDVDQLLDELEVLEEQVESKAARKRVRETMRMVHRLESQGPFGRVIRGFDRGDAAEALLGSVVFGIPMVIEGGTLEAGAFIATHPLYMVATLVFGISIVIGLLYVADIQEVKIVDPYFGIVPRRLLWVTVISGATAFALMTGWGRVDWSEPWLAASQVSVAFVGMAIGAGLGDILPGS